MSYLSSAKRLNEYCTSDPINADDGIHVFVKCDKDKRFKFKGERYYPKYYAYLLYELKTSGKTTLDQRKVKLRNTCKFKDCINPLHLKPILKDELGKVQEKKERQRLTHDEVRTIKKLLENNDNNMENSSLLEFCTQRKIDKEVVQAIANKLIYCKVVP
jgi:hypothetical protein